MMSGDYYVMSAQQQAAWRNCRALIELDRRVRDDPSILTAPPRELDPRCRPSADGQPDTRS